MNKEEATHKFIEDNLQALTSGTLDNSDYKRLIRQFFFERHTNKYGQPSVRDICEALLKYFQKRNLEPRKILQYANELPIFLRLDEKQRASLAQSIKENEPTSVLNPEDLALLRAGRAYEAVELHKGKKITEEKRQELAELDSEIHARKQEYESLPSVLDDQKFEEPDFLPDEEDVKPWWERFYLRSNPFQQKDGLSSIDHDLYESVVVKTEPFKRIQSNLKRDPNCLFNTAFLITGNFGFGKTTFLDYLSFHLVRYDVISVRITCPKSHPTASGFADAFYARLRTALFKEATTVSSDPISIGNNNENIEDQISYLSSMIVSKKRGILIFLDDYHKHRTVREQVFDFLGMLQILKDDLTRQMLKVGFVVAGLPEWEQQLTLNKQLTGFLDSPVVSMPPITPDEIVGVFNQRVAAYCVDAHARTIHREFIERVFKESGPSASYREYLDAIVRELENDNFAIVDSPIEISEAELDEIRKIVERDPEIARSMKRLIKESSFKRFTKRQVEKCLELLVQVGLRGGVSEDDDLFAQNAFYFQRLNDVSLIQKQRTTKSSRSFLWTLRKRLRDAVDEVSSKYSRSLSDYFLKLYAGSRERVGITDSSDSIGAVKLLDAVISRDLTKHTHSAIQQAKGLYESLLIENPSLQQKREVAYRTILTVKALLKAIFQLDGTIRYFDNAKIGNVETQLEMHWLTEEVVTESLRRLAGINDRSDRTELEMAIKQGRAACDVLIGIVDEISRDIGDAERPFSFRHRSSYHSVKSLAIFSGVQKDYFSANPESHFRYVESVTDYLEEYQSQLRTSHFRRVVPRGCDALFAVGERSD